MTHSLLTDSWSREPWALAVTVAANGVMWRASRIRDGERVKESSGGLVAIVRADTSRCVDTAKRHAEKFIGLRWPITVRPD